MHICGFQEVVCDFVLIRDRSDDMRAYMSPPSKSLDTAPRPSPIVLNQFRLVTTAFFNGGAAVCIYPLLYFHSSCAIIKFVRYVCGLGGDVSDLADKGYLKAPEGVGDVSSLLLGTERDQRYLGYFNIVYREVGVGVGLGGVQNLHYGDGSERVFAKLLEDASA